MSLPEINERRCYDHSVALIAAVQLLQLAGARSKNIFTQSK